MSDITKPTTTPLLVRALRAEETPRRPVWIMRQAGRYLPEYRALKEEYSFLELAGDPELAAEVTLQPMRRFPLDAAIIFADIMSPMASMGVDVRFAPGPVIDQPIRTAAAVDALGDPEAEEIAPEVIAALAKVREELPSIRPGAAVIGFAGAPLTLAAYLVQGHGKSDFPYLRALAASDPKAFGRLLELLARVVARYLRRQVEVGGAQAVQIFDSWAGLLSAEDWRNWIRPCLRELLEELEGIGAPRILFLNHAAQILDDVLDPAEMLPFEALAVDWRQDLAALKRRLPEGRAIQGNLDPAVLFAGPEVVRREASALLERVPRRGHVVNLGHGIMPQAPIESVEALIETVRAEG